jgi:hypothetical protein
LVAVKEYHKSLFTEQDAYPFTVAFVRFPLTAFEQFTSPAAAGTTSLARQGSSKVRLIRQKPFLGMAVESDRFHN